MPTTDINKMSAAELKEALANKEAEERAEQQKAVATYERDRDLLVTSTVKQMRQAADLLLQLKASAVEKATELQERSYTVLGKKRKEKPVDSFTILSKAGDLKLVMDRQYKGEYDETADVAIAEIKEVLRSKFEGRNKALYRILDSVLLKNNKGDYDERLVAKLRKHESDVDDERFSKALDVLSNAYRSTTSQTYLRAYELGKNGRWNDISVAFSRM